MGTGESRVKYVGKYRYVFRVFSLVFNKYVHVLSLRVFSLVFYKYVHVLSLILKGYVHVLIPPTG